MFSTATLWSITLCIYRNKWVPSLEKWYHDPKSFTLPQLSDNLLFHGQRLQHSKAMLDLSQKFLFSVNNLLSRFSYVLEDIASIYCISQFIVVFHLPIRYTLSSNVCQTFWSYLTVIQICVQSSPSISNRFIPLLKHCVIHASVLHISKTKNLCVVFACEGVRGLQNYNKILVEVKMVYRLLILQSFDITIKSNKFKLSILRCSAWSQVAVEFQRIRAFLDAFKDCHWEEILSRSWKHDSTTSPCTKQNLLLWLQYWRLNLKCKRINFTYC